MNRRTTLELGLLVLGAVLGGAAMILFSGDAAPPPATPSATAPAKRPAVTGEWRVWRGDASLTGATAERAPDAVALAWRCRTGGPILSSPVVAGGRVCFGSDDGRVYCLDAATGEPVWTFAAGDDVAAPPLAIDGRIFVGAADGTLHALDAGTGEGLWTYATGDRILGGANYCRTADGSLRVLVGSYDGKLHCVDAATGKRAWSVETESFVNGSPAVSGDAVVFGGCDGKVRMVGALRGEPRLVVPLGEGVYIPGSPAVADGVAFVAHVDDRVAAVSIESGEVLWEFRGEGGYFSSPALAPGLVVVGGRDGYLRALDRETGEPRWSFACRDGLDSSPVIAGDTVVVGSNDGRVYAVSLGTGEAVWEYSVGGPVTGSVAVAGGLVFVPSEDGTLYALGPKR